MELLKPNLQIAIDGPVAAGKGTVSKLLAEKLQILYVDTGAMYRALTYLFKEKQVDFEDEEKVCDCLDHENPRVELRQPREEERDGRLVTVLLNGEDISWKIRTEDISRGVAIITRYKCVRDYMVPQQQRLAQTTSVVMEGRDITTRVLPQADLKIYMDAEELVRAKRRYRQLLEKGEYTSLETVAKDLHSRDFKDMHRDIDPLTQSSDSWYFDTSKLSVIACVEVICERLKQKGLIA